jgi:hypothetical protein
LITTAIGEKWNDELRRMNYRKEGRPYKFPDEFIRLCSFIKEVYDLTYRK